MPPVPLAYVGGDGRESRVLEQAHLVLGCQGIGYRDPDYFALAIYSTLFGGGMSSRLFQRIREERGLVYGIHCFNTAYADGGLFGIYAGTGEDDLAELVPAVCEEFAGVADTLTEAELVRARNQIKAGTLMALELSGARSEQAARHLIIHGRPIPYAEIVTRIEAVDQAAVQPRRAPAPAGRAHARRAGSDRRAGASRQDRGTSGGVSAESSQSATHHGDLRTGRSGSLLASFSKALLRAAPRSQSDTCISPATWRIRASSSGSSAPSE